MRSRKRSCSPDPGAFSGGPCCGHAGDLRAGRIPAGCARGQQSEQAARTHPNLDPTPKLLSGLGRYDPSGARTGTNDILITKHRVSAFVGTDLGLLLRAKEIETLVLFGIATSGVVLSTLLEASDAGYRLMVIEDCCADLDTELHAALLKRLFPKRAEVITAADFAKILESD